ARAAKRIPGVQNVRIVYRRNKKYMPADEEELALCQREGVEFLELLSPVSLADGKLTCRRMRLGEPDASGRRSPVETDELVTVPCDLLVAAVGERVDASLFKENGVSVDERGFAALTPQTLETNLPGVYVLGDAHRGPATVVEAIADAQLAANHILGGHHEYEIPEAARATAAECRAKVGELREYDNAASEAERCLYCSASCEVCMQVCPNRANLALRVPGMQTRQILHVDRMCNECGNCAVFCPYDDAPYLAKPTLYHTRHDFDDSTNMGFLHLGGKRFLTRLNGEVLEADLDNADTGLPKDIELLLWALLTEYAHLL
ncbi:MAG: FAD-dependent oxidoreductase, partial [Bacillota bacterium]